MFTFYEAQFRMMMFFSPPTIDRSSYDVFSNVDLQARLPVEWSPTSKTLHALTSLMFSIGKWLPKEDCSWNNSRPATTSQESQHQKRFCYSLHAALKWSSCSSRPVYFSDFLKQIDDQDPFRFDPDPLWP